MTTPIFGITGWKNSGKTVLTCKLVAEFTQRGFRVATVKHAHHDFDIDHAGTDSFRHRKAGASQVAIVSSRRWALMHELSGAREPTLAEVLARMSPCDLILIEGYKREGHPKIEARRLAAADQTPIGPEDPTIVAIASDHAVTGTGLPAYSIDDVSGIADLIATRLGLRKGNPG